MPVETKNSSSWSEDSWREEILRKELNIQATSVIDLASKIEHADDFPTRTPRELCKIIKITTQVIQDELPKAPSDQLRHANTFICELARHLRYAERSRIAQTPWSMIQLTETFFKQQVGDDYHFIIRPQWELNYGLIGEFIEVYRTKLQSLHWVDFSKWETLVGDLLGQKIYSVSFPRIQRLNCLSHSLWGHELGHIIASKWLNIHFDALWKSEQSKIITEIEKEVNKVSPPIEDLFKDIYIGEEVARKAKQTMEILRRGLEELLCDMIGVHLFGPAALAATAEFCARYHLDKGPIDLNEYPPWRHRLRLMYKYCQKDLTTKTTSPVYPRPALQPLIDWLLEIDLLIQDESDVQALQKNVETREAYRVINDQWSMISTTVIQLLPSTSHRPYYLHEHCDYISGLVQKLEDNIPPAEKGTFPDTSAASIQDIFNAGWAYKILSLKNSSEWGSDDDYKKLFLLLLKGLEASFVITEFGSKVNNEIE